MVNAGGISNAAVGKCPQGQTGNALREEWEQCRR